MPVSPDKQPPTWTTLRSGALAGAASALLFAVVHHVLISDIWFSAPLMTGAGAACGLCLAWTYRLMFAPPVLGSWMGYNLLWIVLLALLGITSVVVFEPITTIPALVAANEPPRELIRMAWPLTAAFTLGMALLIGLRFGRRWTHYLAVLLTTVLLVALLGLNVSILGLVYIPRTSLYLIGELFALIGVLDLAFAAAFFALERNRLFGTSRVP